MDRETILAYEERALRWAAAREPVRREAASAFGRAVAAGAWRADLGCGAGRYTGEIGRPAVALDAASTMCHLCAEAVPGALVVRGDLEALPLGSGTLGGAWANMSYQHLPSVRLPLALWDLHRACRADALVDLQVLGGSVEGRNLAGDDIGGRYFAGWSPPRLTDVLVGAGFDPAPPAVDGDVVSVRARRAATLADTVGPGMRLLLVGSNPSPTAARLGVPYAGPGNRFWLAARRAGIACDRRDPRHLLIEHGVGSTDLVKRVTRAAQDVRRAELAEGLVRVERLVAWLEPTVVCVLGLSGWRSVVDPAAGPGLQPRPIAGRPCYVMPSTSAANAGTSLDELARHLAEATRAPGPGD